VGVSRLRSLPLHHYKIIPSKRLQPFHSVVKLEIDGKIVEENFIVTDWRKLLGGLLKLYW
jgi:hypothetical protein